MDEIPSPINMNQSTYNLHDPFKKNTITKVELNDSYYTKTKDDLGNHIISAYDIISTFAKDEWESFWAWWQISHPNWEARLDKYAIEGVLADLY